jgi:hypothetical protein
MARIVITDVKDEVVEAQVKIPQNTLQTIATGEINLEIY